MPLAIPAYLITALLQDLGSILGYQISGLWWGVLILSITSYPYVFILANESFNKFGVNQINASRGLGVGPWGSFFKIALPMACLLYTSPSPRDVEESRMPSSA